MKPPTARSLIFDLLSTLRRDSMPVAALVTAAALFDIAEGSLRVALSRLLADGRIARDERGCYRLGAAAAPVQSIVGAWRELDRRTRPWSGRWIAVQAPASVLRARRPARSEAKPSGDWTGRGRRSAQALRLLGFEPLAADLRVRPANLRDGVAGVRDTLRSLGLPEAVLVFELSELDPASDARLRGLWDRQGLERGYRAARAELERSAGRLPALSEAQAMTESFLLGGRVVQQLVLDPLLPAPLVDEALRHALLESMRAYDRLGREAWAAFLGRFGVPHRSAPADTRWAMSA